MLLLTRAQSGKNLEIAVKFHKAPDVPFCVEFARIEKSKLENRLTIYQRMLICSHTKPKATKLSLITAADCIPSFSLLSRIFYLLIKILRAPFAKAKEISRKLINIVVVLCAAR
jgi:hypothetical protein